MHILGSSRLNVKPAAMIVKAAVLSQKAVQHDNKPIIFQLVT